MDSVPVMGQKNLFSLKKVATWCGYYELGIFFSQKLQTKCGIWGNFFQSVALWEIMSQMVAFGSKNQYYTCYVYMFAYIYLCRYQLVRMIDVSYQLMD
jgi:hypothetical protein